MYSRPVIVIELQGMGWGRERANPPMDAYRSLQAQLRDWLIENDVTKPTSEGARTASVNLCEKFDDIHIVERESLLARRWE